MENSFWQFIGKLGWAILFNILFMITSLPLVTIGASTTALITVMMQIAKGEGREHVKVYFRTFIQEFLRSTVLWVITVVVMAIWYIDLYYFWKLGTTYGKVIFGVTLVLAIITMMMILTMFAVMSKFEGSLKETFQRSRYILFHDFIWIFIDLLITMLLICAVAIGILRINFWLSYMFSWMIIMVFGLCGLIHGYIMNFIFYKYYEEEDEEDTSYEIPEDPFAKLRGEYKE